MYCGPANTIAPPLIFRKAQENHRAMTRMTRDDWIDREVIQVHGQNLLSIL